MTDMLALDIETTNYSHEIGGWDKTPLFEPSVVATWDGETGTVYCKKTTELDGHISPDIVIKKLHPKILGNDLNAHIEKEGMLLGHNIKRFDLPVLKDSLDCWTASDILFKSPDTIFDTSVILKSIIGHAIPLSDTVHHTLGKDKLMNSHDAPLEWRRGQYGKVAKYCLDDAKLVHELWAHGKDEGFIKARSRETGEVVEYEVDWK
mgnify:FL=1|tara:strand:+ start:50 stop:667 length:618 start_codon:yes stop_codon:yes gene_type:complete